MNDPVPNCSDDYASEVINTEPEPTLTITPDQDSEPDEASRILNQNTRAELRELQRLMMNVARTDEIGSARASAAKAWRELEILRLAKLGRPLTLTVSGKAEPRRAPVPTAVPTVVPESIAA